MKAQRNSPISPSTTQTGSTSELLEQIRLRAYQLFEQRGRDEGHDLEDWLQAEAEVIQRNVKKTAALSRARGALPAAGRDRVMPLPPARTKQIQSENLPR